MLVKCMITIVHRATEQMRTYKPAEHEATASVAPLMQFFELVHIGDTIQSIVQVYFDKELVSLLIPILLAQDVIKCHGRPHI